MKKEPFTILESGYIAPNGDFYSCGYFEHLDAAEELLSTFYDYTTLDNEKELLKQGWVSITIDAACCAGSTPEWHEKALDMLEHCHFNVINRKEGE